MNLETILVIAVVVGLFVAITAITIFTMVVKSIESHRVAREHRIMKDKVEAIQDGEFTLPGGRVKGLIADTFITEVTVKEVNYKGVGEAIVRANLKRKDINNLLELESNLEYMREQFIPQLEQQVTEARIENEAKRVEKDEDKQYIKLGSDTEGDIYIYKAGTRIMLSPFVAVDIVKSDDNTIQITNVYASKEGLREGLAESRYVFNAADAQSQKMYKEFFEKMYTEEASKIAKYVSRMTHYNQLVKEKRLLWDSGIGKYVVIPKSIEAPSTSKDSKQIVDDQFAKPQQEPSYTTMD